MADPSNDLPGEALAALENGNKIEAIKHVRIARNTGLKEAKDIVDKFVDEHPDLKGRLLAKGAENRAALIPWLFLAAAIGAVAFYLLSRTR